MSVAIHPGQLRREMMRRGLDAAALARASRLSPPTVSAALAGKRVAAHTMVAIARALTDMPAIDLVDSLVDCGSTRSPR